MIYEQKLTTFAYDLQKNRTIVIKEDKIKNKNTIA